MEGGASMQPDLEYGKSTVSSQGQYKDEHAVLSAGNGRSLQVEKPADKNEDFFRTDHLGSPEGIPHVQELPFPNQPGRRKPSPALWHLALIIGDSILLIALLVRIMDPAPNLGLTVPDSIFGSWNAKLVWLFLALASWSLAINITQAQLLDSAASLLKSPLYALCSLVLMLFFCILLLYLFIGNGVLSYVRSLFFFLVITAPILCVWRALLAEAIHLPRFRRQAVIVGVNAAGESIAREILSARHPTVNVLGYIGESVDGQKLWDGLPVFGGRSALQSLAQNGTIDMMIMAIDYKANPELFQEALEGTQRGISVVPVAVVYESTSGKIPLDHIGDQWSTAFSTEQFVSPLYLCWNKAIDLAFGICGLAMLCILLPVLALLIYLDSPGPIFFSQERAGYRGRTFRMLKFRSMSANAERAEGGAWTSKGDARVTRVGRLLRATHLDELPQVLNIVRGDMSLIGPRPERPEYVPELAKSNAFYSYRLSVRPGLTGWAQVKCGYGSSKQDELVKLQYDLFYIKHRSFLLDILILLKTVREVVLCHGT
jgi:exopolysaccharide biosynthesis polyprenyl glycosylphosphotransferase